LVNVLKAAIAGVGFMSWIHYLAYKRNQRVKLVGFCSRDAKKRAGDWRGIQGNFGPKAELIDVAGLTACEDLDELLANPEIDLIDICLPPYMHVDAACRALAAGKHVFCEKPLGLTTRQCDQIKQAAQQAGRQVLVAQVLPFMGEFQYAYQAARSGQFGQPKRAHFKRIISPPDWIPDFYDASRVGGPLVDLHVHDAHFTCLLFGLPKRVMCSAQVHQGVVKFCHTLMEFDQPGHFVACSSGVTDQRARPFCHGFEVHFEKAVMQYELSVQPQGVEVMPLSVLCADGSAFKPSLEVSDEVAAFSAEIDDLANAIDSGNISDRLSVQHARDAIHICQCLQQSAESGQWVACR
jgi:predicted dehydrogenase